MCILLADARGSHSIVLWHFKFFKLSKVLHSTRSEGSFALVSVVKLGLVIDLSNLHRPLPFFIIQDTVVMHNRSNKTKRRGIKVLTQEQSTKKEEKNNKLSTTHTKRVTNKDLTEKGIKPQSHQKGEHHESCKCKNQ